MFNDVKKMQVKTTVQWGRGSLQGAAVVSCLNSPFTEPNSSPIPNPIPANQPLKASPPIPPQISFGQSPAPCCLPWWPAPLQVPQRCHQNSELTTNCNQQGALCSLCPSVHVLLLWPWWHDFKDLGQMFFFTNLIRGRNILETDGAAEPRR